MEARLKQIGKFVAIILAVIVLLQFLYVLIRYCDFDKIDTASICVEKMVYLLIPTEVSIVQGLESFPILLLIVLFFYWKYVNPPK